MRPPLISGGNDNVYAAVKTAAEESGMLLRKWVEKTLAEASTTKPKGKTKR